MTPLFLSQKNVQMLLSASGDHTLIIQGALVIKLSSLQSFEINVTNLLSEIKRQGNGLPLVSIPKGHSLAPSSRPKASVLPSQPLQGAAPLPFAGQRPD